MALNVNFGSVKVNTKEKMTSSVLGSTSCERSFKKKKKKKKSNWEHSPCYLYSMRISREHMLTLYVQKSHANTLNTS